jgi:signal transduction histidine kinase
MGDGDADEARARARPVTEGAPAPERTARKLAVGLGVIAAIFVAQGITDGVLDRGAEVRARDTFETSLASVEQITRIVGDVRRERILIADHVLVRGHDDREAIDAELARLTADIRQTAGDYVRFVTLPNEATLWAQAEEALGRFQRDVADVVQLAHRHRFAAAAALLTGRVNSYAEVDRTLVALVRLNRAGAAQAMDRIRGLQAASDVARWATRIAGLLGLLFFGWWGVRRIAGYERQITRYARGLEERNRDLDAFAGRVAHDLRSVISPIAMSPPALRRFSGNPPAIADLADRIERYARRASTVLDALLAFSRAAYRAAGEESAGLRAALRDVQDELRPLVARVQASFEVGDVPDVHVRCSRALLHVALANLCSNAIKYLEGRAERRAHVSASVTDGLCRIDVEDTGPGIPADARERIFEPFFRVEGSGAPGIGIGLATVERIVGARDGRVAVESAVGKGSRFTIWLPVAREGH